MTAATDTFEQLKAKLRELGFDEVHLETSDQSAGYGFVVTALYYDGRQLAPHRIDSVTDKLMDLGLLDIDWDGPVGEDEHGYAQIEL